MSIFKAKGASARSNQRLMFLQCCLSVATTICKRGKDEEIMIDRPNKKQQCQEEFLGSQLARNEYFVEGNTY